MEADFWLDKWTRNEIGFHEDRVHPLLKKYWRAVVDAHKPHLDLAAGNDNPLADKQAHDGQIEDSQANKASGTNVFVPLCGKSLDLLWLADCGHHVYGVELSEIAVESLFTENDLVFERTSEDLFTKYSGEHCGKNITIWCGDYFSLTPSMLPTIHLFYDRAAFIALSPQTRSDYLDALARLLGTNAFGLMVTLEYVDGLITPPPHSITPPKVKNICSANFLVETLGRGDSEVKGKPCTEHALLMQTIG